MALLSNELKSRVNKREADEGYLNKLERLQIAQELIIEHLDKEHRPKR